MPRYDEGSDSRVPVGADRLGVRHYGDGLAGEIVAARLQGFNPTNADYRDIQVDANGVVQTSGSGSGGGGAVTIADGADVAQGSTTDASSANTVVGLLKAIKAAVTGTLSVATHAVTQSGTWTFARSWTLSSASDSVNVGNFPATQAVSIASMPATPVTDNSGSLTVDAPVGAPVWVRLSDGSAAFVGQKVAASSVPVVIASDQSSLPTTEARLPAALGANGGVKIEGVASGTAVPVSGTFWQATQPVSAAALPLPSGAATSALQTTISGQLPASLGSKASAASLAVVVASDQGAIPTTKVAASGQANVLKTGSLATSAVTVDQVVLTYTVTALKTFYLCYLVMYGRLTTPAATASVLGAISLETPSGTKAITLDDVNPTTSEVEFNPIVFAEPIPIAAGVVVRVVVTPAATTAMTWRASFGGYEK